MDAKQGTILIAEQMAELLGQLSQSAYCQPLSTFHGASVGQHFRHIIEFYTCLFDGVEPALVDYGCRKRNAVLAENPEAALTTLEYIAMFVYRLDEQQRLNVESDFSETTADDATRPVYMSSIGRELQYAFDHAIHHLALIRIGLEIHFPEIQIPEDLGVAPSTLKYKRGRAISDREAQASEVVVS